VKTAAVQLAKYNLHLVSVQDVKWEKGGSQPTDDYTFFHGNVTVNHH
jgi:hypothetical protein